MSNTEKRILVAPKGCISIADRKLLQDANYIVIETDEPDKIKLLDDISFMSAGIVYESMVETLQSYNSDAVKTVFAKAILNRVKVKKSTQNP